MYNCAIQYSLKSIKTLDSKPPMTHKVARMIFDNSIIIY